jgi:hypothetical protein
VISRLDVVAALCRIIPGTHLGRNEDTEEWKETKQISLKFSVFIVTQRQRIEGHVQN